MQAFLTDSLSRAGADTMVTPREIIRDYVTLLDLLLANPDKTFEDITGTMKYSAAGAAAAEDAPPAEMTPGYTRTERSAAEDTPSGDKPGTAASGITIDDLEF